MKKVRAVALDALKQIASEEQLIERLNAFRQLMTSAVGCELKDAAFGRLMLVATNADVQELTQELLIAVTVEWRLRRLYEATAVAL